VALNGLVKRDGSRVPFDPVRIVRAIDRALKAVSREDEALAEELGQVVIEHIERACSDDAPGIEEVQDAVIFVLQESGNYDVALAYSRYRDARERQRRQRRLHGDIQSAPNLTILGRDNRRRPWSRECLEEQLRGEFDLEPKAAVDVAMTVEGFLAESSTTELTEPLLLSLVDAALVRCDIASAAEHNAPLRLDRAMLRALIDRSGDGERCIHVAGEEALRQLGLAEHYPPQVLRLFGQGRLWVDGLGDPLRGSEFSAAVDGSPNPWQILTQALGLAIEAARDWRQVNLIMPPIILGHLERGAQALLEPLERLARQADCYLYCDGRTPLLQDWPFSSKRISIATYAEDFLLLRRLDELGLKHLSGPHLMQGGYRRRVAVKLALNAQGLEDQYTQMDALAMGLVAAARVRQRQLADNPHLAGADIRYAIFGLPPNSPSNEYLERQVVQEGLRCGMALSRSASLPEEACEHLGRLFE